MIALVEAEEECRSTVYIPIFRISGRSSDSDMMDSGAHCLVQLRLFCAGILVHGIDHKLNTPRFGS